MKAIYLRLGMLSFCCFFATIAAAQNEIDAMRYSGYSSGGTARSMGMAGAFSAVGADFSSAWLNPAGLALYRKSDFQITPTVRNIGNEGTYSGQTALDRATNFGFSSLGYVHASALNPRKNGNEKEGFKSFAFSFGFNQTANYYRNTALSAFNPKNSITEYFSGLAEGYSETDLSNDRGYQGQAYAAGLLVPDTAGDLRVWLPAVPGGNVTQNLQILEKGRNNEWSIGLAGNVGDLMYIGASMGIEDLKYSQELYFQEKDIDNLHTNWNADSTNFNSLDFFDYFRTRGSGLNARLGVIVRPVDYLRISLSAQSPTWYNLTDTYYSEITATYDGDPGTYGLPSDKIGEGKFTYNLTTPYKVSAGLMLMIKKMGFVTADVDVSDYSSASFASDNSPLSGNFVSFSAQNAAIRQNLSFAYNFRFGGEFRFDMFRFWAGYANYGSVLKPTSLISKDLVSGTTITLNGNRRLFSGGFGVKLESFYIDLAIVREASEDRRVFYTLETPNSTEPDLINKKTTTSSLLTIGFTF